MGILYGTLNVDEKYSAILEPNLFFDSVFVPGVTYTDIYEEGPAGSIYVHKLATTPTPPGKVGRDFVDEDTSDELIQIVLNNNFQKSKKIYGVQSAAVAFNLANEQLSLATQEVKESWNNSGVACLVNEGSVSEDTAEVTNATDAIIAERKEITKKKGKADVVLCSPDFFATMLKEAGDKFTPTQNDKVAATGAIGTYLGMTFIECANLSAESVRYTDSAGSTQIIDFSEVQFVMYNHNALSIVNNLEAMRLVDSENFVGSKAQVEMNTGYKVTNEELVRIRKVTA